MVTPRGDDPLRTYREKRRFAETPEPRGRKARKPRKAGRLYTIQKHAARRLHYDLRLELDGVLKSWAVTRGPSLDPSDKRLAVRTEDHPVEYAEFEGIIPAGNYGAGTVMLWDRGSWEPIGDPREGLERGKLAFRLDGERLRGRWALVRFRGAERAARENWLLVKELDEAVDRGRDLLAEHDTSVASGRDLTAIAEGRKPVKGGGPARRTWTSGKSALSAPSRKLPAFVEPQLATLVETPPEGGGWLFEVKFDGYRALLAASGDAVRLLTRNGLDWTERFAPIAAAAASLGLDGTLIDGEVTVVDGEGRSDFAALQHGLKEGRLPLSYFAFDLLADGGRDLRKLPLAERKRRLEARLGAAGRRGPIYYTDHLEGGGEAMLEALCRRGFEGVIAKSAEAPYRSGRGRSWLKIKCGRRQEFVVGGWSASSRGRPFSSLLLGVWEEGGLRYAGRVGAGFTGDDLAEIAARLRPLEVARSPFAGRVTGAAARSVHWARPRLVAEVAFTGFTRDGLVRHGRFLGLREDKPARNVRREEPQPVEERRMAEEGQDPVVAGVRLSNADRVLYREQGLTKRDLARYYERIAPAMLPFVARRLVSLVRCPQGRSAHCFFQRHAGQTLPAAFRRLDVAEREGGREEYIHVADATGLVAAAQFGVLELHIWGSRIDDVERPDRVVFDLDPGDDVPFAAVKEAGRHMRDALEALGLVSFPLLTGGKGLHVVCPITRRHAWPTVKAAARALAERFAEAEPDRYVAVMAKARRHGRIFIDYLRNDRTATAIAPFSTRARQGAPLAWPVAWEELEDIPSAAMVRLADVLDGRREPAPWKGYGAVRQGLTNGALRALGVA